MQMQHTDEPADDNEHSSRTDRRARRILKAYDAVAELWAFLRSIDRRTTAFRATFGRATLAERADTDISLELVRSWTSIIMTVIQIGSRSGWSQSTATTAMTLLEAGIRTSVRDLARESLLKSSVLMPLELSSLISYRFIRDLVGSRHDIVETYSLCVETLVRRLLCTARLTDHLPGGRC